ncbi:MAG: aminotransferase class I/II-fold pyridoxal phosphate-dependent enzyme [Bryobacterales bacterium]|nr:aminotransferase class I/II-fold pyridoxal phosphate-dependent enzyme [Bryobacterales bacterium]
MTRRTFALSIPILTEAALAQRAAVQGPFPPDTVWLNANENPEGPPKVAMQAMIDVLPKSGRYHYQEYRDFYAAVAASEGMEANQLLVGAGSSEVLQAAIHAFTGADRPLIQMSPTYESPASVMQALDRKVIRVPLTSGYYADVKELAKAAEREGGGLIYICNPNNPTGAVTPKKDIDWLIENLPTNTVALIDEAYIHFAETPDMESAFKHIKAGKNVVVTRSYSKIFGMAGLRAGSAYGRPDLIGRMAPVRNNVISIVAVRALLATFPEAQSIVADRKTRFNKIRRDLCSWFKDKGLDHIESHTNFVMVDLKRDVRPLLPRMVAKGVAVGRPFPPLDTMLRVSIGTAADMDKFRRVFWEVYSS